jgi:hypothetical protein
VSRDLPIPGSPAIRITWPSLVFALVQRLKQQFGLFFQQSLQ